MKHKLTVAERFVLLGILPEKGNYATQKVVNGMIQEIGFSAKELKDMEYVQEGDQAKWNPEKEPKKEVDFGSFETDIIKKAMKELDEKEELERRHMSLYEKFVDN